MSATDLGSLSREELVALVLELAPVVPVLQERVAALEEENRRLREQLNGGSGTAGGQREPPAFVKANRPARTEKPRKQREHPACRRREEPTQVQEHMLGSCPECGRRLSEGWVARTRQVIELPEVQVQVIEHRMWGHHCGVCQRNVVAQPDLSAAVLGQHRVGVRLMSLIVFLREEAGLPVGSIQRLLLAQYGLHLSEGEVVEVLHAVAACGGSLYEQLKQAVRAAPVVHADETGWREDGENGYLWGFSTAGVLYLQRRASRAAAVAKSVLGEAGQEGCFRGVLCSDFYSAYSFYPGEHQRCWVHLLRDLKELEKGHAGEPSVGAWVAGVRGLYRRARDWVEGQQERASLKERRQQRFTFQEEARALARPFARVAGVPQRVLAQRLEQFASELFVFVEDPAVPSDNNAAERSLRPLVTGRKVSGGTRSAAGSHTRCVLRSLLGTWKRQGMDLLATCQQMLAGTLQWSPA